MMNMAFESPRTCDNGVREEGAKSFVQHASNNESVFRKPIGSPAQVQDADLTAALIRRRIRIEAFFHVSCSDPCGST